MISRRGFLLGLAAAAAMPFAMPPLKRVVMGVDVAAPGADATVIILESTAHGPNHNPLYINWIKREQVGWSEWRGFEGSAEPFHVSGIREFSPHYLEEMEKGSS